MPWLFIAVGATMGVVNWDSIVASPIVFAWLGWVNRVPLAWVGVGVVLIVWTTVVAG